MEVCAYPDLKNHIKEHQQIVNDLNKHKKAYDQGELPAETLLDFLASWIKHHIMGRFDQDIANHVLGKEALIKNALKEAELDRATHAA